MLSKRKEEQIKLEATFQNNLGVGLVSVGAWGTVFSLPSLLEKVEPHADAGAILMRLGLALVAVIIGVLFHKAGIKRLDSLPAATASPSMTTEEVSALSAAPVQPQPSLDPRTGHPG